MLLAIAYLVLAIRENIWCWLCAAVSSAIYVWIFIGAKLYMESGLYAFYFIMALYGWAVWRKTGQAATDKRPVVRWPLKVHVAALLVIGATSLATGFLLATYTDAAYPYIDSLTTWSGFWATFLVARKVLENWWYWLVIDVVSIYLYWSRDLEQTALLFVLYVILIPFGVIGWTRSWREGKHALA